MEKFEKGILGPTTTALQGEQLSHTYHPIPEYKSHTHILGSRVVNRCHNFHNLLITYSHLVHCLFKSSLHFSKIFWQLFHDMFTTFHNFCSWLVYNLIAICSSICSSLAHEFFITCLGLVHNLFMSCPEQVMNRTCSFSTSSSWLVHNLFIAWSRLVHNFHNLFATFHILFMTCSHLFHIFPPYFTTCSWIIHYLFHMSIIVHCSQFFMTCSQFVHYLFMSCS